MLKIDDTRDPFLVAEFTGEVSQSDAQTLFETLVARIRDERAFGMAVRAIDLPIPALGTLRMMAEWIKDNREGMGRYNVALGIHLESAALRGTLKFINTLAPPPSPQESFPTWDQTEAWVLAKLRAHGLEVAQTDRPAAS